MTGYLSGNRNKTGTGLEFSNKANSFLNPNTEYTKYFVGSALCPSKRFLDKFNLCPKNVLGFKIYLGTHSSL
jgi:hypothetical protein